MIKTIAEIGQAHNGSLELLYAYIDAVAITGADAIKFQTHIADAESSIYEPFRVKFSEDKTRFDYWKRMEFSLAEWIDIGKYCKKRGLQFISSPFSNAAVDILEQAGVDIYKVGSGEVTNHLLLKKIIETEKPIIISSGMSSFEELDHTVAFLKQHKADFSILQCTTSYPTMPESYGLNVINELKLRYGVTVGFSDHSAKVATGIAAVALGAEILEFHVVLARDQKGPDVSSSLTIEESISLIASVKDIDTALTNPVNKYDNASFSDLKQIFEKSLAVNKDLTKGHILQFGDLEAKKPKGYGINAGDYKKVIGRAINKNLNRWEFLNEQDLV
ncbi:N-acetylneuraminate synthase family protein [Aestuariibaculum sp. YM273]|uniref:N-acetylneuraminate synthase family protein n=1 Tax=Aestuariibaculum sp. YM273 TaxID=3070659 RepID=UPI0027DD99EF|nr:N-acetylneuraminate synthase family protein [Aestuariibaculum sp. YM273]WMI65817.1 N-acetylneuraminate synthase family protein [Aestuariibaculum sp. YM273]